MTRLGSKQLIYALALLLRHIYSLVLAPQFVYAPPLCNLTKALELELSCGPTLMPGLNSTPTLVTSLANTPFVAARRGHYQAAHTLLQKS